ncbi:MAG: helix-turn-helix domain-containing protein [Proteobacteria bacterium]|nr:helix-turn-helix domain-containing protein [Pseudomonadota bacterium]
MARPFKQLRDRMRPEARERVDRRVRESLRQMSLQELRQQVTGMTQTDLAELMDVTQGAISQLEKRHDVLLSKLASYVHALGGELELIARFPDADVRITQFGTADASRSAGSD